MALTESTMLPLGTKAPDFLLIDTVTNAPLSLEELASDKATVIMFSCNHCPYVIHVNAGIVSMANDYIPKGVSFIAISSNDVDKYPQDGPLKMKELAEQIGRTPEALYQMMSRLRMTLLLCVERKMGKQAL